MAIVKMKKFHLLVLDSHREKLLKELQLFRNIQFEDVCGIEDFGDETLSAFKRPAVDESVSKYDDTINQCSYAIDLINKYSPQISGIKGLINGLPNYTFEEMEKKALEVNFNQKYTEVKGLGDELSKVESNVSKNRDLIKELEPVANLDVSFTEMSKLEHFNSFVGGVSGKIVDLFIQSMENLEYTYWKEIGVYKDEHFFFIITDVREEDDLNEALRIGNLNKIKIDTDLLPGDKIDELQGEISKLEKRKEEIISEIAGKQDELEDFKLTYEYYGNLKIRALAEKDFMKTSSVCVLTGYCPEFDVDRLEKTVSKVCKEDYIVKFENVDKDCSQTPILLKNNKFVKVFESVTSTYALPRYNEVDPTPLYAPVYALFFGMMSADFGYGLVILILTTLALKKCNLSPDMKKNVKFFQLISISTAVWGFLYGSYFGASIPGMWRLFDLSTQFMNILILSIIMGGIHLYFGLAVKAYMLIRDKQYIDMIFQVVSWYVTLSGIIVLLLSMAGIIQPALKTPSMFVMILGIVMLIVGGAMGSQGNILKRLVAGIYNVYGISSYIGDFVSYSRLMALGMAGGYIAFSVNMIAGMVWGKTIVGYVAAIFILIFFHAFNLFLSCLGAYVHSLRLVYVEFFGKFYEGGGKAFRFFRNKTKYINLDRHYED